MTEFKKITGQFAVAPQIGLEDIAAAKAQGYRMIVCNRPDGEEPGQPAGHEIGAAAGAEGLKFAFIPISGGNPTAAAIHETRAAMRSAGGPILAYCKSGMRSSMLWALAMAAKGDMDTPAILSEAQKAGYDLGPIAGLLEQIRTEGL